MSVTLEFSDNVSRSNCVEEHDVKLQSDNGQYCGDRKKNNGDPGGIQRRSHDSKGDSGKTTNRRRLEFT